MDWFSGRCGGNINYDDAEAYVQDWWPVGLEMNYSTSMVEEDLNLVFESYEKFVGEKTMVTCFTYNTLYLT